MCALTVKLQGDICNAYVHMQSTMGTRGTRVKDETVALSSAWHVPGELSDHVPDWQSWPPGQTALMWPFSIPP